MKKFQIMRYIQKVLPVIVVICLLATCAIYFNLNKSNSFVASEVIHYNDPLAESGLTPKGSKLDVNEIKSSSIMSQVVDRLGLKGSYSVDNLISRVTITPLPDADKLLQKEAKLEEGEEYIYEPSKFIVSFTATSKEGSGFARTILDEMLDVYFSQYSQKYVNIAPAKNVTENLDRENYDYIEMAELIETSILETVEVLYQRTEMSPYYRASATGVSFMDLANEFSYLRSVKLSSLFAKIYKYQITKNKTVLVSDYQTRIDNNDIANVKEESIVKDVVAIIDAYVEKMRNSGNTNITYEYILEDIYERDLTSEWVNGDQTVTYDELIYSWRDHNEEKAHSIIDTAYCQYILDTFTQCTGACENEECQTSLKTCAQLHSAEYTQATAQVEAELTELIADLTELYEVTQKTNEEYNAYLGASYISVLSTVSVKNSINVKLYTAIAFIFLVVLGCGGAIVLGRIGDILHYIFYTDHLTELNNRAYFDKYLKSMDKMLLDDGTVYCMVDISNLATINAEHTRQTGDGIIKLFTSYLQSAFGKANADFIYNGNGSFIIVVSNSDYITVEDILHLFGSQLGERDTFKEIRIEYKVGVAETFNDRKTARRLLSETIKNKKEFVSEAINR